MRRLAVAALFAALFAALLAAPVWAKGPDRARVCGASGCVTMHGGAALARLLDWTGPGFTLLDAPRPAPYYRFSLYDRGRLVEQLLYVPSRRRVRIWELNIYPYGSRTAPYWRAVTAAGVRALGRATQGLTPFPSSRAWR